MRSGRSITCTACSLRTRRRADTGRGAPAFAGVQVMTPLAPPIVMPVGGAVSEYVIVAPGSGSVATAVRVYGASSAVLSFARTAKDGASSTFVIVRRKT